MNPALPPGPTGIPKAIMMGPYEDEKELEMNPGIKPKMPMEKLNAYELFITPHKYAQISIPSILIKTKL